MGKRKSKGRQESIRNANRTGGTSTRPDGRVEAYLTIDTLAGPHRIKTTKATQELADAWLLEARPLARQGAFGANDTENLTVAEFVGRWLEDEVRPTARAVTFAGYEQTHRLRIVPPPLGTARLSVLSVANCQAWRARMAKNGVTASELGKAIRLLKRALEQAFAWEMIPKNPAAHLKAPRYRPKETAYVRAEDVPRYLAAALDGPRPAELLALRWEDFDEAAGTLRIDESVSHLGNGELDWNEPKSEMGLRVLPLAGEARMLLGERRRAALEAWMASDMRHGGKGDFGRSLKFPRPDDPGRPYGRHALLWRWADTPGQGRPQARPPLRPQAHGLDAPGPERDGREVDPGANGARGRQDDAEGLHALRGGAREGGGEPPRRLPGRHFGVGMTAHLSAKGSEKTRIPGRYAGSAEALPVFARLPGV